MDVVTGAFGYIGRYIARALLEKGRAVCTITTHPDKPNPFGPAVEASLYNFDHPDALTRTLNGKDTLYNTYWMRFPYGGQTYESALANTNTLFRCARQAGVKRIVHIGVTRASPNSGLPYYRGNARQESLLRESGVPFSIVRPALVFGKEDILVNNIAWLLRKFPMFPMFGEGRYRVQPVFVEDLAEIAIRQSVSTAGTIVDAIGPETFTFYELVALIAAKIGRNPLMLKVPPDLYDSAFPWASKDRELHLAPLPETPQLTHREAGLCRIEEPFEPPPAVFAILPLGPINLLLFCYFEKTLDVGPGSFHSWN